MQLNTYKNTNPHFDMNIKTPFDFSKWKFKPTGIDYEFILIPPNDKSANEYYGILTNYFLPDMPPLKFFYEGRELRIEILNCQYEVAIISAYCTLVRFLT